MEQEDLDKILGAIADKLNEVKEELKEFTKQEIATQLENSTKSRKDDTIATFEMTQKVTQQTAQQVVDVMKKLINQEVPEVDHAESLKRGETVYYLKKVDDGNGGTKKVKKRIGTTFDVLGRLSETADMLTEFFYYEGTRHDSQQKEKMREQAEYLTLFSEMIVKLERIERMLFRSEGGRAKIEDANAATVKILREASELAEKMSNEQFKPNRDMRERLKKASLYNKRVAEREKRIRDIHVEFFNQDASKKTIKNKP